MAYGSIGRGGAKRDDCALQLVRAGGVPRLYRGLAPSLLRAAPSAAIQFAAFDFFSGVVLARAGVMW